MNFKYIELILNKSQYMNILYGTIVIIFIFNSILYSKYNKINKSEKKLNSKYNKINKSEKKSNYKDTLLASSILSVILIIILMIKPLRFFFFTFSIVFLAYIFIISPLLDIKKNNIITNNEQIVLSIFFLTNIYTITNKNIINLLTTKLNNAYLIQSLTIIILVTLLFCIIYVVLINIYWLLFYINELYTIKFYNILCSVLDNTDNDNKISEVEEEIQKDYKWNQNDIKKLSIVIIKLIKLFLIEFILFTIIRISIMFFECILKITENYNYIIYKLSKLAILISMFITYIIIQINNTFSTNIISIFELIITSTIIPIIIEKLISKNTVEKKESNVS